jgi:hypothetical protein
MYVEVFCCVHAFCMLLELPRRWRSRMLVAWLCPAFCSIPGEEGGVSGLLRGDAILEAVPYNPS